MQGRRRSSAVTPPAKDDGDDGDFQTTTRHSVWQKRQVKTWIVNVRSRNAAERSISSALTRAKPYERIELVGGEYHETVSITFPVEIVASEGERPVIVFRGTALQCAADVSCVVHGVSLQSRSKNRGDYAVVVSQGKPEFIDCSISSMHITGHGAPTVHDCDIVGSSNGIGVRATESCSGLFTHCRIHSHQEVCVSADCAGDPTFRENTMYQVTDTMVVACEGILTDRLGAAGGGAIFENNTIYTEEQPAAVQLVTASGTKPAGRGMRSANGETANVYVAFGASPTFRRNELIRGGTGFLFEVGGVPKLEANMVRNMTKCGVRIALGHNVRELTEGERQQLDYSEASPAVVIDGNNVFDRCRVGIDIVGADDRECRGHRERSLGRRVALIKSLADLGAVNTADLLRTAEARGVGVGKYSSVDDFIAESRASFGVHVAKTRFIHCSDCAVRYGAGSFGHMEDCDVESTGAHGIVVTGGSCPVIARCRFMQNGQSAVHVTWGGDPLILANTIKAHRQGGLVFGTGGAGIALDNQLTGNEGVSILVAEASGPLITRNLIHNNTGGGVVVETNAKPRLLRNCFTHNGPFEIRLESSSAAEVVENDIKLADTVGLHFTSCAGGTARGNSIVESRGCGVIVELDADPLVLNNTIKRSGDDGIRVRNNGLGTIVGNEVAESQGFNVHIIEGGDATVRDNYIVGGIRGGIGVSDEGCGVVEKNRFMDNGNGSIVVSGKHTSPLVVSNRCDNGPSSGIIVRDGAGGTFRKNTCSRNAKAGILCIGGATPTFEGNVISSERVGILCDEQGAGTFRRNRVTECSVAGMLIQGAAAPKVVDNVFLDNHFAGVTLGTGCSGMVIRNAIRGNAVGISSRATVAVIAGTHDRRTKVEAGKSTVVEDNDVTANLVSGVLLESEASGRFVSNRIHDNGRWGVLGHVDYADLVRSLNADTAGSPSRRLQAPEKSSSIAARVGGGYASFRNNVIHNHDVANVAMLNHPVQNDFIFEANELWAAVIGLSVEGASVLHRVVGNKIRGCGTGIFVGGCGRGRFETNEVLESTFCNVHLALDAQPDFGPGNVFNRASAYGCYVEGCARGSFSKCTFADNSVAGVVVVHAVNGHKPTTGFDSNTIEANGNFGVFIVPPSRAAGASPYATFSEHSPGNYGSFEDTESKGGAHGGVHFEGNRVVNNTLAGVYVSPKFDLSGGSHRDPKGPGSPARGRGSGPSYFPPLFMRNTVADNRIGVVVDANSEPVFKSNTVESNVFFGIIARPFAMPAVTDNVIDNNGAVGLFCAQQAKGRYIGNKIRSNNPVSNAVLDQVTGNLGRQTSALTTEAWRLRKNWSSFTAPNDLDDPTEEAVRERRVQEHGAALAKTYEQVLRRCSDTAKFYGSSAALRLATKRTGDSPSASMSEPESPASVLAGISPIHVNGVGVWLEQGGECDLERNEVSGHRRCGFLYSTLALLDSAGPELDTPLHRLDSSMSASAAHELATSSSQTTAAGGGSTIRENIVSDNDADGFRIISVVRVAPGSGVVPPNGPLSSTDAANSTANRKTAGSPANQNVGSRSNSGISTKNPAGAKPVRRRSVVMADPPELDSTQVPSRVPSGSSGLSAAHAIAAMHAEDASFTEPSLAELTDLTPSQRPPLSSALVVLRDNVVKRNGRFGVYIEQLYTLVPRPGHAIAVPSEACFDQLPSHRLVLPPRLEKNRFASNVAAAVCIRLSTTMDGETGAPLGSPSSSAAASRSASPVPTGSAATPATPAEIISGSGTFAPSPEADAVPAAAGLWYCAPQLSRNEFDHSDVGVLADQGANAVLTDNSFKRQAAGVVVRGSRTDVVVGDGNIFALGTIGVQMETTLRSKVMRSTFDMHTDAAVLVRSGACPTVVKNLFRAPPGSNTASPVRSDAADAERSRSGAPEPVGLCVVDCTTKPMVFGNRFQGMRLGAHVADFAVPVAWRNKFVTCNIGLSVDRGGEGFFGRNLFQDATTAGVLISHSNSHPVYRECVFSGCERAGLQTTKFCGGRVERCLFTSNHIGILADDGGTHFKIPSCVFRGNTHVGIAVRSSTRSTDGADREKALTQGPAISDCFFDCNADADVTLKEYGTAQVLGCVFMGKCVTADSGTGLVEGNRFCGRVDHAIIAEPGGAATFRDNVVTNAKVGLGALTKSTATFTNNLVFSCEIGIEAERGSHSTFSECNLSGLSDCGIKACGSSFDRCSVTECPVGIVCPDGLPNITEATVRKCTGEGVLISGGGIVSKSVVSNCRVGIRVMSEVETPTVDGNTVMDCSAEGVFLEPRCRCTLTNNDVFDHGTCSLAVQEQAKCTIEGNRVSSPNDRSAMDLHPEASCIVRNNTIRNQFSPAYKKALASQRAKDLTKSINALATKLTSAEGVTSEWMLQMQSLAAQLVEVQRLLEGEAVTPPRDREFAFNRFDSASDGSRTPSAPTTPRDSAGAPRSSGSNAATPASRRRAASLVDGLSSPSSAAKAPAPRMRSKSSVSAKLTDAVNRSRSGGTTGSKTAKSTKAKSATPSGAQPKVARILLHRFNNSRGTAASLSRDLGGQFQSATENTSGVTAIATTSRDPVSSVLRTSSCDGIVLALPCASETLTEDELTQLAAVDKFIKARNLSSIAMKAAEAGRDDGTKPAKSKGLECVCVLPKFFLSSDGALFGQPAVASFLRTHRVLVDDGSTGFLNDLVATSRVGVDPEARLESLRKYAIADGFIPARKVKAKVEADGAAEA